VPVQPRPNVRVQKSCIVTSACSNICESRKITFVQIAQIARPASVFLPHRSAGRNGAVTVSYPGGFSRDSGIESEARAGASAVWRRMTRGAGAKVERDGGVPSEAGRGDIVRRSE